MNKLFNLCTKSHFVSVPIIIFNTGSERKWGEYDLTHLNLPICEVHGFIKKGTLEGSGNLGYSLLSNIVCRRNGIIQNWYAKIQKCIVSQCIMLCIKP